MNKPLQGVRVLDLTHMLAGPYGAMMLADLGAETIKVEPLAGEGTRKLLANDPKNSLDGMGAYYLALNRNKQSIAIDLKSPDGQRVFHDLVRESDVVISNFGVGVPERLGIDYDTLQAINPRIITCTTVFLSKQTIRLMFPTMVQTLYMTSTLMGYLAFRTVMRRM